MKRRWWNQLGLAMLLAGSAGCASGNSWTASLPWSKPQGGQVVDGSKSYSRYQDAQKAHRELPPPKEETGEPGTFAKMTGAISAGSSKAVKSVTSVFRRDNATDDNKTAATPASARPETARPNATPDAHKPAVADSSRASAASQHVTLAQVQERAGQFAAAAREYETALKFDPQHIDALLGFARLHDRQNNFAEATVLYQRGIQANPQEATAYNDLALCLARQGKKEEAVAALKQAIRLRPAARLYRNNIAKVLLDLGRHQEALEQLVVAHPASVANYNMGFLLSQQGDQQAALRYFSRALELDPNFGEARRWVELLSAQTPPGYRPPQDARIAQPPVAGTETPARPASPAYVPEAVSQPSTVGPRYAPQPGPAPAVEADEAGPVLGPAAQRPSSRY